MTTDFIKNGTGRLAGVDLMKMDDDEKSFDELHTRIIKTISYLNRIDPEQINGSEEKEIKFSVRNVNFDFKGLEFLQSFVIPNIYFHVTTAYAILRNNNFRIGKKDFLNPFHTRHSSRLQYPSIEHENDDMTGSFAKKIHSLVPSRVTHNLRLFGSLFTLIGWRSVTEPQHRVRRKRDAIKHSIPIT